MVYKKNSDIFFVLADPVRRRIIEMLSCEEFSVNEILKEFSLTQPAISKHLKILRESGLVIVKERGKKRFYTLENKILTDLESWIKMIKYKQY